MHLLHAQRDGSRMASDVVRTKVRIRCGGDLLHLLHLLHLMQLLQLMHALRDECREAGWRGSHESSYGDGGRLNALNAQAMWRVSGDEWRGRYQVRSGLDERFNALNALRFACCMWGGRWW